MLTSDGAQTDTHGWLEGHLTETNYGADWGDVVSFTARMRAKAKELGVDLLLVDTGLSMSGRADFGRPMLMPSQAIFMTGPA